MVNLNTKYKIQNIKYEINNIKAIPGAAPVGSQVVEESSLITVIPAKAGIQKCAEALDSRLRGNDKGEYGNNKWEYRNDKRKHGYVALTTVLLVGVVGTSISVSLLLLGIMHTKTAMTVASGNNAYSYSEACIEDGLRRINQNVAYTTTVNNTLTFTYGGCSYSVTGTAPDKVINSTGTSNQATRRIKVIINQTSPTISVNSWQEVVSF